MNARLEQYVEEVGRRLNALPIEEAERQMQELRQHLEALVAARSEIGEDDAEAAENALRQFGGAEMVGANLAREHRRAQWRRLVDRPITMSWVRPIASICASQWRRLADRPIIMVALAVTAFLSAELLLGMLGPDAWYRLGIRLSEHAPVWQVILYLATEPKLWLFGAVTGLLLRGLAPRSSARIVLAGYLVMLTGLYIWCGDYRLAGWAIRPLARLINRLELATIYGALASGMSIALCVAQRVRRQNRRGDSLFQDKVRAQ